MIKDIEFPKVKGVSVAITRKMNELNQPEWTVRLINKNDVDLHNVLICSKGYGIINEEKRTTSTLRHLLSHVPAKSNVVIEPIDPAIFLLNNEYWVSYYVGETIFDKKFIFLPETILESNLIFIPSLNMNGILHD
jgi:hypothetical protein